MGRAWPWLAGALFVAGCLVGWRAARPGISAGPSADSAAIEREREQLARDRAHVHDQLAALTAAGEQLARDSARIAAMASPRPRPPRPAPPADTATAPELRAALDAALARGDTLEHWLAKAEAASDSALALQGRTMTAYRGAVEVASFAYTRMLQAEGALSQAAHRVGTWHRRAAEQPRWSAGPVWEPGRLAPVGGYIDRDVGPLRLGLQVTDGASESPTVRGAVGLRF